MGKIKTKQPIFWGGFDCSIANNIEITLTELSKNESGCTFGIRDVVMFPKTHTGLDGIEETYEVGLFSTREKQLTITTEQYNGLYQQVELFMQNYYPGLTELEKELKRPSIGLLLFFCSDVLTNGKLGYNTEPTDWEIV